jgi:RNA polymerase sigma-70 factor (ECF subfamily)
MMATSISLLERLRMQPDEASWKRLDDLYRPLLRCWLHRIDPSLREEVEDLVQEVMSVLVRELSGFSRERAGSFRRWLRRIAINRLRAHWRSKKNRPSPLADPQADFLLTQLEDPVSEQSRQWDLEHDQHILGRLLEMLKGDFAPTTFQAFRRMVLEGARAAEVARELGLSVNAVLLARSRVLRRLRQEGKNLLD